MREMKDSGVEWIGEIPKDWESCKLKNICAGFSNGTTETQVEDTTNYPVSRIETISKGYIDLNKVGYVEKVSDAYKLHKYDFLISNINSIQYLGNFAMIEDENLYHGMNLLRVIPQNINPKFLYYYFKSICFRTAMQIVCKPAINQASVSATNIKAIRLFVPSGNEQKRIADYLDRKCSQIDSIIEKQQAIIEKLKEYKLSVITEAVTKGLNPDVEMKDSGIEWIGMVPKHWEINPLFTIFGEGKNKNKNGKEQNLLSLSYGKIVRKNIKTNEGLLPENFNAYNIIEDGDIIIRPTDLQNDKRSLRTGLVKEHGIITSAYIDLRPYNGVNSAYYHYLLHSYDIKKVFYNMGNGVRQGLNYSEFSKLKVLFPTDVEQNTIVEYLDKKVKNIDEIIQKTTCKVDKLQEYKKSLIYEVVTGKKEV